MAIYVTFVLRLTNDILRFKVCISLFFVSKQIPSWYDVDVWLSLDDVYASLTTSEGFDFESED